MICGCLTCSPVWFYTHHCTPCVVTSECHAPIMHSLSIEPCSYPPPRHKQGSSRQSRAVRRWSRSYQCATAKPAAPQVRTRAWMIGSAGKLSHACHACGDQAMTLLVDTPLCVRMCLLLVCACLHVASNATFADIGSKMCGSGPCPTGTRCFDGFRCCPLEIPVCGGMWQATGAIGSRLEGLEAWPKEFQGCTPGTQSEDRPRLVPLLIQTVIMPTHSPSTPLYIHSNTGQCCGSPWTCQGDRCVPPGGTVCGPVICQATYECLEENLCCKPLSTVCNHQCCPQSKACRKNMCVEQDEEPCGNRMCHLPGEFCHRADLGERQVCGAATCDKDEKTNRTMVVASCCMSPGGCIYM